MSSFRKHTELDYYWNNLPDLQPKHRAAEGIVRDPNSLIMSRRVQLRCFNCGKMSRSVYTGRKCSCGHYLLYAGKAVRRAAKSLHNAGFELRGAFDSIITDSSDTALCFICVDFAGIYDERCFFGAGTGLTDGWHCRNTGYNKSHRFTRLYNLREVPSPDIAGKAETLAELKCLAAELECWGREIESSCAAAVMTLAGYGSFWRIPGFEREAGT